LLRAHGTRQREQFEVGAPLLDNQSAQTIAGATLSVDLWLESAEGGVVANGTITTTYQAICGRCLTECSGDLVATVDHELFVRDQAIDPLGDFSYSIVGDEMDLEPLVTDAVVLELPLAPLCKEDCAGLCPTCGVNRNEWDCGHEQGRVDDRWAALDALRSNPES
jgi:uncharacterized protein